MEFVIYDTDFGHKKGEFCIRQVSEFYFLSHFHTDFLYEYDGNLLEGRAGDLMIMPPKSVIYHGPREDAGVGFVNDWIYVGGDDFSNLLQRYPVPQSIPLSMPTARILGRCIEMINREKSYTPPGYEEKCNLYMTEAIIDIYRYISGIDRANEPFAKLERLKGELVKNSRKSWTLSEMATFSGYSESRFCALYKSTFKISPIKDLLRIRIENAKLLLSHSSLTVSEIAEAVGFSTIYYFSKYFKDYTGTSPTEYKNSLH